MLIFEGWMRLVDNELLKMTYGQSTHNDLIDQPWREWYDSGVTPLKAAEMAFENELEDMFFDPGDFFEDE